MGLLLILLTVLIGCTAWFWLTLYLGKRPNDYNDYGGARICSILLFVITAVVSFAMLIDIATKEYGFQEIKENYASLKEYIENARSNDLSEFERFKAIDQITEMNEKIAKHRVYANTFYLGIFYSEDIAKLEYLK